MVIIYADNVFNNVIYISIYVSHDVIVHEYRCIYRPATLSLSFYLIPSLSTTALGRQ